MQRLGPVIRRLPLTVGQVSVHARGPALLLSSALCRGQAVCAITSSRRLRFGPSFYLFVPSPSLWHSNSPVIFIIQVHQVVHLHHQVKPISSTREEKQSSQTRSVRISSISVIIESVKSVEHSNQSDLGDQ